ncbi:hypothetical protein FOZ63_030588 [Perkinsus olseni]|uniref:Secreted protein n=1 Tax=Perkinsus olseni TaxID=32597 RepID=A0A7J6T2P2_PEROL|nr:hypothetical protein FOZ63_030588 [Perkinsus olseni]
MWFVGEVVVLASLAEAAHATAGAVLILANCCVPGMTAGRAMTWQCDGRFTKTLQVLRWKGLPASYIYWYEFACASRMRDPAELSPVLFHPLFFPHPVEQEQRL